MRSGWLADAAPPTLGGIAEAAWIGVYAAALSAPAGGTGSGAGLAAMSVAALCGVAAGRRLPFQPWRPAALLVLAALAALAGIVVPRALEGGDLMRPTPLLADLLLGLAVLRGAVHGDPGSGDSAIDHLVRRSPVLLAGGWLLGLAVAGAARTVFVADAFEATLLFVVAAALGLGSARLLTFGDDSRYQQRPNRAWLVLVAVVVGAAVVTALPVAAVLGLPIAGAVTAGLAWLLLGLVAIVMGPILILVEGLAALLQALVHAPDKGPLPPPPPGVTPPPPPAPAASAASQDLVAPLLGVVLLVLLLAVASYLAVRWRGERRATAPAPDVAERRSIAIDLHLAMPALHPPVRLRARRGPRDALGAYPRLLADWAPPHPRARNPAETPAAHAGRLRAAGEGGLGLDLLVADYELARFGGVVLSEREERKAVARWRRLRDTPSGVEAGVAARPR